MGLLIFALLLGFFGFGFPHPRDPKFSHGRTAFVHLFEWKWTEIAKECEIFLGPYGYGGVQVSPPNENIVIWEPGHNREAKRPWYERYQPVSYKIGTRSGNEDEFKEMVDICNKAGVRIYADIVMNHMTGHYPSGHGTAGSFFDPAGLRYDGVPYGPFDFTERSKCNSNWGDIEDYNNFEQVRNCRLSGLNDLDQSKDYVRGKISEYMNKLIGFGVAGFRIDAAKHMWPVDLEAIFNRLDSLNSTYFGPGKKPFIFLEVIGSDSEPIKPSHYTHLGQVTEFKYGRELGSVFRKHGGQRLKHLRNFGEGWGMEPSDRSLVFIDNHDNQRGHGGGGLYVILTFFDSRLYKMASAFMLAWPYGTTRVMSSYRWPRVIEHGPGGNPYDKNDWIGPPHDGNYNTLGVTRNEDLSCGKEWVCEHRWREIYNMVKFRNIVAPTPLNDWWDNGYQQIAFGRGDKGFIAINNEDFPLDQRLQTGLLPGRYCDIISGNKVNGQCTGRFVDVDENRKAHFFVDNAVENPVIAIHEQSKL